MNGLIVALCILLSLVSIGNCTICKQCWVLHEKTCHAEQEITCSDSLCMTMSQYATIEGNIYPTIKKNCGDPLLCNKTLTVTTNSDFNIWISIQCGDTDNSNENLNFAYPTKMKQNGKRCPSCYSNATTNGCKTDSYVNCFEGEEECLDYGGTVMMSDGVVKSFSVKGCITTNGCDLGFLAAPGVKEVMPNKIFQCTPALKSDES
ncbi:uncharacterized protein O3C94_014724 [Discoglossus pictus]